VLDLTIEVPTRDGTVLRGLHYVPAVDRPAPTVLTLTPYNADRFHHDGMLFASRGFHFVSLDVRGRGDSDGTFTPFVFDGVDGHDAVEWLGEQPWCDGDVVMYGGSYGGFVQWTTAARRPAHLRGIAPVASVYPGVDFPMQGNISKRFAVRWLALISGRRKNTQLFEDEEFWRRASRDALVGNRPYRDLDLVSVGRRLSAFQEWLDHPDLDDYWARLVPDTQQYREITVPVLTITGQYDDDQLGALRYHDEHISAVTPEVARRHHVIIGPWDHEGTRSGARSFGGLAFAESSEIDLPALHADWYDWVLQRATKPTFLDRRVVYFHVGEDRWRSSDSIPAGAESLRLYPDQGVDLAVDPGRVAEEPPTSDYYTLPWPPPSAAFLSEPLPEALDLTGRFQANLGLVSDLPDFDLLVGIYLLRGGTSARLLTEAVFRARYRTSLTHPTAWPTETEVDVVITGFPFVSLRTTPGDRIGLVIRPPHRRFQTNFHSGKPSADERPEDARAGQIRLVRNHLTIPLTRD
jgi:uncharacterized protein